MGIRYYAYPVPGDLVDDARRDPGRFLGGDPLADAWQLVPSGVETAAGGLITEGVFAFDENKPRPTMLYLDKAYSVFQALFASSDDGRGPRSSYALVQGELSVSYGEEYLFTPWVRVLDAATTAAIAADVKTFEPVAEGHPALTMRLPWAAKTINAYLADMRDFMADRTRAGDGVVYTIT